MGGKNILNSKTKAAENPESRALSIDLVTPAIRKTNSESGSETKALPLS